MLTSFAIRYHYPNHDGEKFIKNIFLNTRATVLWSIFPELKGGNWPKSFFRRRVRRRRRSTSRVRIDAVSPTLRQNRKPLKNIFFSIKNKIYLQINMVKYDADREIMNTYENLQRVWSQFFTDKLIFIHFQNNSDIYWFICIQIWLVW